GAAGGGPTEAGAGAAGGGGERANSGISLAVAAEGIPAELIAAVRERRPDADPASLVAASWPDARRMIEAYVAEGLSKFVVRPAGPLPSADRFLGQFVSEMMPLQTA